MVTQPPKSLNYEDVLALGEAARLLATGKADQLDRRAAFCGAMGVAFYAGGQLLGNPPAGTAPQTPTEANYPDAPDVDWEQVAAECEKCCDPLTEAAEGKKKTTGKVPKAVAAGLDWKTLLKGALKLLILLAPLLV